MPLKLPPYFFTSSQNTTVQVPCLSFPLSLCVAEIVLCSWHFPHRCLLLARQCRSPSTLTSLSRWRELSSTRGRKVSPLTFALHLPPPAPPVHRTPTAVCVRVKITLDKSFSSEHKVSSTYGDILHLSAVNYLFCRFLQWIFHH